MASLMLTWIGCMWVGGGLCYCEVLTEIPCAQRAAA